MRPYHCYFLDDHGMIRDQQVLVCDDDREVGERAFALLAQHPRLCAVEVWNGARRLELQAADPRDA